MDPFEIADGVTKSSRATWWASLDAGQQAAWKVLAGAASVGVLGTPILQVVRSSGVPGVEPLAASVWLLIITLPLAGAAALGAYLLTSPPKTSPSIATMWLGVAAVVGIGVMDGLIKAAGSSLGPWYCYNDGTVTSTECRPLEGDVVYTGGSPAQSVDFLGRVSVVLIDARGWLMVSCGVVAGLAVGYLLRRESDGPAA